MRWVLLLALLSPIGTLAQHIDGSASASVSTPAALILPDSPGAALFDPSLSEPITTVSSENFFEPYQAGQISVQTSGQSSQRKPRPPQPCVANPAPASKESPSGKRAQVVAVCPPGPNPYVRFLNSTQPIPLTPTQKGYLAIHDIIDPFNLLTIAASSAFSVGIDAHSAYGPGMKGFGKNAGYSLSQDATGEFIGTFVICSLLHEDPHYHRLPEARPLRRLYHAISRTVIAQRDDGRPMINVETLLTYPISAGISNLYVPGIHGNGPSTFARIVTGLATDPVNNIITEFLPDFASHVHIRVLFVQQLLNQITSGQQL